MENKIAVYNEFKAQLEELREYNNKAVFDYATPKGNKEARSHIYKLRQTKSAIDRARKAEKQSSLEYGKRVDSEAKLITLDIETMISVHQKPLDEIEQREKQRVSALQVRLQELKQSAFTEGLSAHQIGERILVIEALPIDESFAEFTGEAATIKDATLRQLRESFNKQSKHEAEQAELERLRKEAIERAQKEREERIAKEAAEKAKHEAEIKAKRQAEAKAKAAAKEKAESERLIREAQAEADRKEMELKLKAEMAQREKEAAERRAEQAEARAKAKAEAEKAREIEEQKAREADTKHRKAINNAALKALIKHAAIDEATAKEVIQAIARGQITNVEIHY